eukprot:snap_masked-scaffold_22-processed-gene-4.26-mRNA-1 protein AED:1.00 eAED:1.00 QI:0/-1/0/0/-1/1/1/0/118
MFTHPKIREYIQENEEPIPPAQDPATASESHQTALFQLAARTFNPRRITLNSNLRNENMADWLGILTAPRIPTSQLEREQSNTWNDQILTVAVATVGHISSGPETTPLEHSLQTEEEG